MDKCVCFKDPAGNFGLHGFEEGQTYKCEKLNSKNKPSRHIGDYYKVWMDERRCREMSNGVFEMFFKLESESQLPLLKGKGLKGDFQG